MFYIFYIFFHAHFGTQMYWIYELEYLHFLLPAPSLVPGSPWPIMVRNSEVNALSVISFSNPSPACSALHEMKFWVGQGQLLLHSIPAINKRVPPFGKVHTEPE